MADLLTHVSTAFLAKSVSQKPHAVLLATGVVLPDVGSRLPGIVFDQLGGQGDLPMVGLLLGSGVLHTPIGIAVCSLLLALCFVQSQRAVVFWNLLAGGVLHLALDVMQRHLTGGYQLWVPWSYEGVELGWISSESTVWIAPVLLPLSVWAWRRRRPSGGSPS
ncbi:MAG: metal-dependent hydrolase [Myxococcota bacterium]|nr:metal-dependent hydrolase [Myxococcota bacterium]